MAEPPVPVPPEPPGPLRPSPEPRPPSEPPDPYVEEISLLDVANVLLRRRRWVFGVPAALVGLLLVFTLLGSTRYTVSTSFTPQTSESSVSRLSSLAARFGVSVPAGGESAHGPEFYADLLKTRTLLRAAVETEYSLSGEEGDEPRRGDLVALYEVKGRSRPERVENAIDLLDEQVSVGTDVETGVVTFRVTTPWPELSERVAARLLELVNEFNLETRQSQASAERRFIEERLAAAREELAAAEDSLKDFLERNRRYENSPELVFEYDRLKRHVDLQQQLFTTLSESYEEAKIEEVRNTPVLTVVEPPEAPVRPDSRHLFRNLFLALFLGGMIGVGVAFVAEFVDRARREGGEDYREFAALRAEFRNDLRAVAMGVRRFIRGRGRPQGRSPLEEEPRTAPPPPAAGSSDGGA